MKYADKNEFKQANVFGTGIRNFMLAKNMTGRTYVKPIKMANGLGFMANVSFAPGARCFWHIASPPIVWVQGIANLQHIVFVAMVEVNRSNNFISLFNDNSVASWKIFLFIALRKNVLQIINLIFQGLDGVKCCWIGDLWETSVGMDILGISHCSDS